MMISDADFALDGSNFYAAVLNHRLLVVLFSDYPDCPTFAHWCKESSKLFSNDSQVVLAKVNAKKNKALAANCGIRFCPTIIVFKDGGREFEKLDGPTIAPYLHYLESLSEGKMVIETDDVSKYYLHRQERVAKFFADLDDVTEYDFHPRERVAKFFAELDDAKVMLFVDRKVASSAAFISRYNEVAMGNKKHRISFMLGDIEASKDVFLYFKLHGEVKAPLIVVQTKEGESYSKENLESEDEIVSFIEDYRAGMLSTSLEGIGPVVEVDAQSFQKKLMNSDKNVFMELGPWCQRCRHCKTLDHALFEVAHLCQNEPNVVISKLYNTDPATRCNGLLEDPHAVKATPTLYFKRASGKRFMIYHGLRTAECIKNFIQINKDDATSYKPVQIKCMEEVNSLTVDQKIVIVGVFPKLSGQAYDNFCEAADKLKKYYEFRTMHAEKRNPLVRLFNPFLYKEYQTNNFDVSALVEFVQDAGLPPVILYDKHPAPFVDRFLYGSCRKDKAMLFINRDGEDADSVISKYTEIAVKHKKNIIFMLGDLEASGDVFRFFYLEKSQEPLFVIMNSQRVRYVKECLTCHDDIEALVKNYLQYVVVDDVVKLVEKASKTCSPEDKNDKVLLYIKRRKDIRSFKQAYEEVARKYEGQQGMTFLPVEVENPRIVTTAFFYSDRPAIIIMNSNKEIAVRKCSSLPDIDGLVKDYQEGKVANYRKSVRPLDGMIQFSCDFVFEYSVVRSGKNVLLVAEGNKWINIGKLASVLSDVAFHFSKEKEADLLIARMPWSTVNGFPSVSKYLTPVYHYFKTHSDYDEPTFFFIKKDGEIEAYESDIITPENLIAFIEKVNQVNAGLVRLGVSICLC